MEERPVLILADYGRGELTLAFVLLFFAGAVRQNVLHAAAQCVADSCQNVQIHFFHLSAKPRNGCAL